MTYGIDFPRVDPQLQGDLGADKPPPTKGGDCSVKVIQGGVRWATRGAKIPTVAQIRAAVNVPSGGLGTTVLVPAYTAFGVTAELVTDFADVLESLRAGYFVHCCIGYDWVNTNARHLSGQTTFNDDHGIGAFGIERHPPLKSSHVAWLDPLHDSRHTDTPQQIVMARLRELEGAMAAFGTPNKTRGVVVTLAPMSDDGAAQRLAAKDASFDAIKAEAERGRAA